MGEFDPFFDLNLSIGISEVCEVHHGGLRVDGLFQVVTRLDDYELDASGAQLVIERIAVGLLDDDFRLSCVRMPARPDCIAVAAPDVTMAPYPSGSLSISAMRLPAATSKSGMLTKWRPAMAITASTSGRIREPPSIVMVPCPLMTVVTPNSS